MVRYVNNRNITSHIYDEAGVKEIYERIKNRYTKKLNTLKELILKSFGNEL